MVNYLERLLRRQFEWSLCSFVMSLGRQITVPTVRPASVLQNCLLFASIVIWYLISIKIDQMQTRGFSNE